MDSREGGYMIIFIRFCFTFFALALLSCCSNSQISNDRKNDQLFIVDSVVRLDSSKINFLNNMYPWERISFGESYIGTNSCGFVDIRYRGDNVINWISEGESSREKSFKFLAGEACDFSHYMFYRPTILVAREWEGYLYIINSAPLYRDSNGNYFIASVSFINSFKLESLVKNAYAVGDEPVCVDISYYSQDMKIKAKNESYSEIVDGEFLCMEKGVYVDRLKNIK